MGIGKSDFGGNSVLLGNLLMGQRNLKQLSIGARLKKLDAEMLLESLNSAALQLEGLKLTSVCLSKISMPNLSRFILRQRKLRVLVVHHVSEATQRTALNECEVK